VDFVLRKIAMCVGMLMLSSVSHAELINADWFQGDGKAALDTNTNKGWLDFTQTSGYSMASIAPELEAGGIFDGWRLPSRAEVDEFFVTYMPSWSLTDGDKDVRKKIGSGELRYQNGDVMAFRNALGYRYSYYTSTSSRGLQTRGWLRGDDGNVVLTGAYRHHYWNGPYDEVYQSYSANGAYTENSSNSVTGVWLVADNGDVRLGGENGLRADVNAEVPLVGAAMMGLLAGGLVIRRRTKKQA